MLKLFLGKRLKKGNRFGFLFKKREAKREVEELRNRRIFARFPVTHKHLTLLNEQDILLIRNVSSKGFCTEVSKRCSNRLLVGDLYDARIRYLGEVYDLQVRVAWKTEGYIGFEIDHSQTTTMAFLQRLIRPMEIAASLDLVDESFTEGAEKGKIWFHGDHNTDLFVWRTPETGKLTAWELNMDGETFSWSPSNGLRRMKKPNTGVVNSYPAEGDEMGTSFTIPDNDHKLFVLDIIVALPHPVRDQILETLKC